MLPQPSCRLLNKGIVDVTDAQDSFPTPELADIGDFLRQSQPFDELASGLLDPLVRAIEVRYHRRGEQFTAESPIKGLRVLRSGAVDLRDGDKIGRASCRERV